MRRGLAEKLDVKLASQVIHAATGMHGAGESGASCGRVEGGGIILCIIDRGRGIAETRTVQVCRYFAACVQRAYRPGAYTGCNAGVHHET